MADIGERPNPLAHTERVAVERAVAWHRDHCVERPMSMRERCESDITAYEASLTKETWDECCAP